MHHPAPAPGLRLRIGAVWYRAEHIRLGGNADYLVVRFGGKRLWVHIAKSIIPAGAPTDFAIKPAEDAVARNYVAGTLRLYRGVGTLSAGAKDAKNGVLKPKPDATDETPDFTSEHSTTKFVPFSTSRATSIAFAKSAFREKGGQLGWLLPDDAFGILVTVTVNTGYSLCIFDIGEVQVLAPPTGTVTMLTAAGAEAVNLADNEMPVLTPLDRGYFAFLEHLLNNRIWDSHGVGFFGAETPEGILRMRAACAAGRYWDVFRIAKQQSARASATRSATVRDLYEGLTRIFQKLWNDGDMASFRGSLREFSQWDPPAPNG